MASDHLTDTQIDAFMNTWCGLVDWRQGVPDNILSAKVADLRAALGAAERAAWQPIETAPRDGTRVQLLAGGDQFIAGWMTAIEDGSGDWIIYRRLGFDGQEPIAVRCLDPDKWRPLPPPPEPSHD